MDAHSQPPKLLGKDKRHRRPQVKAFLEHLAVQRYVAAATQNQALNALVFLYRYVLDQPLGDIGEFSRARLPYRLLVMLRHEGILPA